MSEACPGRAVRAALTMQVKPAGFVLPEDAQRGQGEAGGAVEEHGGLPRSE